MALVRNNDPHIKVFDLTSGCIISQNTFTNFYLYHNPDFFSIS